MLEPKRAQNCLIRSLRSAPIPAEFPCLHPWCELNHTQKAYHGLRITSLGVLATSPVCVRESLWSHKHNGNFRSFALLIALALAAYNLLAGALALRLIATGQPARISPERLADTARRAGIAGFLAVTGAAFALIWSVFTNDFSITYILEHSNRALPAAYKFSALWSGQEGSLLLWAWLLGTYGFVLRLTHKTDVKLYAYAGTILAGIQVFFLRSSTLPRRPSRSSGAQFPTTATASIPCSSIRRW